MSKLEKKMLENPDFECLKHYIERGMMGLMEAAKAVTDLYYKGYFAYDEAETAIRLLSKVKVH